MDEQTTQQEQQQLTNPEAEEQSYEGASLPEDEPQSGREEENEPEVSLQDGEVNFSDDFFDDAQEEKFVKNKNSEELSQPQSKTPDYYTDEDLQNLPYEQWDMARMPEEVKRYAMAMIRQREAQNRQRQYEQNAQTPPPFLQAPKEYTPKELNSEAMNLAIQKLGLASVDDFDEYDAEHRTALDMARYELIEKNSVERANYQRAKSDWAEHQRFNAQFEGQPDYPEFKEWFLKELPKYGYTPQQINEGFIRLAREQGLQAVRNAHLQLLQEFRASKVKNVQSRPKVKKPPVLESTRGGNYDGVKNYNMKEFSRLDEEGQVQALIDMGIV